MSKAKVRLATAFVLASAMLVSLAVVGSAAFGKSSQSAAQAQYKVQVCHRTHSTKKPFHTITISASALPAHLRHGDTEGPCVAPAATASATTTTSTSSTETSSTGHGHGKANGKGKNK